MDFEFTAEQQLLMDSFESLLAPYRAPPHGSHGYIAYSEAFQAELQQSGFLEVTTQDGFGPLEGALLVEAAAACPVGAELAGSVLVGPLIVEGASPLALAFGLGKPVRYLEQAEFVCLIEDGRATFDKTAACAIRPLESVAAYPMASFEAMPDDPLRSFAGAEAQAIHRRALIGIAAEAAGLMRGALEHTVQYVKDRQQFGQPLGHFQAIQHRLAEDMQLTRACRALALRAAWADSMREAATACLYAQEAMRKVINDCHQFCGAMGLTLEFPLHCWTYRMKVLQGEAGGKAAQARIVSQAVWPQPG